MRSEQRPALWQSEAASKHSLGRSRLWKPHRSEEFAQLGERLKEVEAKLMAWYRNNECCRRLAKIPGVGPIGAVLLVMKAPAPEQFRSGRQFAAWMGLTPKDHSTAGKVRLGVSQSFLLTRI